MDVERSLEAFMGQGPDQVEESQQTLSEAPQNTLLSAMLRFMKTFRNEVADELRGLYPGNPIDVEKSSIIVKPAQDHEDGFSAMVSVDPDSSKGMISATVSMGDDVVSQMTSGEMAYFDAKATPREVAQTINDLHGRVLDKTGRR